MTSNFSMEQKKLLLLYADPGSYYNGKTPTFSGYTADELKPQSNVITIPQIVAGIKASKNTKTTPPVVKKLKKAKLVHDYRILDLTTLGVDQGAYQRLANKNLINKIALDLNPDALLPPLVCERKYNNNEKVVADGLQRATSAFEAGATHLGCIVVKVNTLEEEAKLFHIINIDRRSIPTPVTHRNSILMDDLKGLALEGAMRRAGFSITEKGGYKEVRGVTRLHTAAVTYKDAKGRPNYPLLTQTALAYNAMWPEHEQVHLYLFSGVAFVIYTYDVEPEFLARYIPKRYPDGDDVVKVIKRNKAAEQHRLLNDYRYATTLVKAHNGKRVKDHPHRLDLNRLAVVYGQLDES